MARLGLELGEQVQGIVTQGTGTCTGQPPGEQRLHWPALVQEHAQVAFRLGQRKALVQRLKRLVDLSLPVQRLCQEQPNLDPPAVSAPRLCRCRQVCKLVGSFSELLFGNKHTTECDFILLSDDGK